MELDSVDCQAVQKSQEELLSQKSNFFLNESDVTLCITSGLGKLISFEITAMNMGDFKKWPMIAVFVTTDAEFSSGWKIRQKASTP